MNRSTYILCLLLCGCDSAAKSPVGQAPILVLEKETVDLGEVVADTQQKITVKLKNHGTEALKVAGIETSCTCSGASVSSSTIAPNTVGELWIGIQPKSSGPGSATIKLQTNCSINPRQQVRVHWDCVAPVEIVEPLIEIGSLRPGSTKSFDVAILCRQHLLPAGRNCRLSKVMASDPHCVFTGTVPQVLSGEPTTTVGKMTITAGNTTGDAGTRLALQVDGAFEKELFVQVAWKVVSAIEVFPQRLSLGESFEGSSGIQSGEFFIQSHEGELSLGEVKSSVDWMQATQEQVSPTLTRLTVKRVADLSVGIHAGEVHVAMKSPGVPVVTVPISLTISAREELTP